MAQSDWLTLNTQRAYPIVAGADFSGPSSFSGNEAFADLGFTLGIDSNFEPGRDTVYLDEWKSTATLLYFSFRVSYGASATYDPLLCFRFVFAFVIADGDLITQYAPATRITEELDSLGEANPALGFAFMTIGDVSQIVSGLGVSEGSFLSTPTVEAATLQSDKSAYVSAVKVANEPRPCPPACPCDESSSSSLSSSSDSSQSSSSSSSSSGCVDPQEPEPTAISAPTRTALPNGTFLDVVPFKAGYNSIVEVDELQNSLTLGAGVERGEGMQCEDLRMTNDGSFLPNSCLTCGELVMAINGVGYGVDQLQLIGGPGVVVTPDAANHRVVVRFEEEGICELSEHIPVCID